MLATAWVQGAKSNHIKYIRGPQRKDEGVLRKKYLHVLRPLLSVRWLRARGRLPPLGREGGGGGGGGGERRGAEGGRGGCGHGGGHRWPPLRLVHLADDLSTDDLPADVRRQIVGMLQPEVKDVTRVTHAAAPGTRYIYSPLPYRGECTRPHSIRFSLVVRRDHSSQRLGPPSPSSTVTLTIASRSKAFGCAHPPKTEIEPRGCTPTASQPPPAALACTTFVTAP